MIRRCGSVIKTRGFIEGTLSQSISKLYNRNGLAARLRTRKSNTKLISLICPIKIVQITCRIHKYIDGQKRIIVENTEYLEEKNTEMYGFIWSVESVYCAVQIVRKKEQSGSIEFIPFVVVAEDNTERGQKKRKTKVEFIQKSYRYCDGLGQLFYDKK